VENFPTLLIKRRDLVLFYGTMLPTPRHLKRTLEAFLEQSSEESQEYAFSNVERHGWQDDQDLRRLDAASLDELCPQA
jgi:thioredoxin 1